MIIDKKYEVETDAICIRNLSTWDEKQADVQVIITLKNGVKIKIAHLFMVNYLESNHGSIKVLRHIDFNGERFCNADMIPYPFVHHIMHYLRELLPNLDAFNELEPLTDTIFEQIKKEIADLGIRTD